MPVPATVQAVLAARIDRLAPEEKGLLQTAAVLGTDVPFAPAAGHCGRARGGAAPQPGAPASGGSFCMRPACFPSRIHLQARPDARGGLRQSPAGATQGLHARLVEAIEALAPTEPRNWGSFGRSPDQVERLAHHALRGEVWDKAVLYCQQAGARAYDRAAFREAVAASSKPSRPSRTCPRTATPRVLAIDLRLALGRRADQLGEYGGTCPVGRGRGPGEGARRSGPAGTGARRYGLVLRITGDLDGAMAASRQALDLAVALGDSALQAQAS